jgi:hypothetical protein
LAHTSRADAMTTFFLVNLRMFDDTFYRAVMAERMLDTPEMRLLRELAQAKGFRVDLERMSTIEEMERFLEQLP